MIAGVYFWRLNMDERNPEGVEIKSVTSSLHTGNQPLRLALSLEGDRLLGVDPSDPETTIVQGVELVGTRITVVVNSDRYDIEIAKVIVPQNGGEAEQFWVDDTAGHRQSIETYVFQYRPLDTPPPDPNKPLRFLCSEGDANPDRIKAIAFGGDTYDPVSKWITLGDDTIGWINIACVDSAPYKMHKIGYTTAAERRHLTPTTLAERQAMLNAWTANVCGPAKGTSFTRPGEEIALRETHDLLHGSPYNAFPTSVEAIWDEDGAVCLNVPRLWDSGDDICRELRADCPLPPPCDHSMVTNRAWIDSEGTDWSWTRHGSVLTGNLDRF